MQRQDATWAQRTPASAPPVAHELAAGLDERARALGERMAATPEPWLARQLGVLAPSASPALREEYTRRAGLAAAYREAAGITNPDQAVSPEPHRGNPRPPQRVPDLNPPSASRPEPRTSPENEPAHENRAARLDELQARADQAAQRIAAQQAERQASSDYAARMEREAQTQAEAGQQVEARDEIELEL